MNPEPATQPKVLRLTPMQEGLLFHSLFDQSQVDLYMPQLILKLSGAIDVDRLRVAVRQLVARHDVLRTTFHTGGRTGTPVQVVAPQADGALNVVDLSNEEPEFRRTQIEQFLHRDQETRFDLNMGPLARFHLLVTAVDRALLVITHHHLLFDGWSSSLLIDELISLARGVQIDDLRPPVGIDMYLEWLATKDTAAAKVAWRKTLAGLPRPTLLAPISSGAGVGLPTLLNHSVDAACTERLRAAATRSGVTLSTVLQTAWGLTLAMHLDRDDVVFGWTSSGRTAEVADVEHIVGLLVSTTPVRLRVDRSADVRQVLIEAQQRQNVMSEHEHLGLELIQSAVGMGTLFDTLLVIQNYPPSESSSAEGEVRLVDFRSNDATHYPLGVTVYPGEHIEIRLDYQPGSVPAAEATELLDRYLAVLNALAHVGDSSISAVLDRARTAPTSGGSLVRHDTEASPASSVVEAFDAVAERLPDSLALKAADGATTYSQLRSRAEVIGANLRSLGVQAGDLVGICLPRTTDLVAAVLGVWKAGAGYVPLDPSYPSARLEQMVSDAKPALILTDAELPEFAGQHTVVSLAELFNLQTPDAHEADSLDHDVAQVAYVIYTSGSTGTPKGVVASQHALLNLFQDHQVDLYPRVGNNRARVALGASVAFDAFVDGILWLAGGHEVHLLDEETRHDAAALVKYCTAANLNVVDLTPTFAELVLSSLNVSAWAPTLLIVGGEPMSLSLKHRIRQIPGLQVCNFYGPTETTIDATRHHASAPDHRSDRQIIGTPVQGAFVYVLDAEGAEVPDGDIGELHIGGGPLAWGYLGNPRATADRFQPDPHGPVGGRMYATGDLARRRGGGVLEFVGRQDDQVKIRGFRVELQEIEAALSSMREVAQSAVVADGEAESKRILAYIVPDAAQEIDGGHEEGHDQVDEWLQIHEDVTRDPGTEVPFGEDFDGWDSSYDGQPIPIDEMRTLRDATVAQILAFKPSRVLEVGIGSGLILAKVRPHVKEYWGTDFSSAVISVASTRIAHELNGPVHLRTQQADQFEGLPSAYFDTAIINSVVQYFPDAAYLERVVRGLYGAIRPGGRVFVGDVRRARTLELFNLAIQGQRIATEDVNDRARAAAQAARSSMLERELVIDPEFFVQLGGELGAIVEIRLKEGQPHNELTRHRYEVFLHHPEQPFTESERLPTYSWSDVQALDELPELLATNPSGYRVLGVPNARLAGDIEAAAQIDPGLSLNAPPRSVDPEDVRRVATAAEFEVRLTWDPNAIDRFEVLVLPGRDRDKAVRGLYRGSSSLGSKTTNAPAANRAVAELPRRLRSRLAEILPDYMVPSEIVTIASLPLTTSGKLNRRALPEPEQDKTILGRAPAAGAEETIAAIFAGVLGLERVTAEDDFFGLGGNSLLAIRAVARTNRELGTELSVRAIFETPTVAALAASVALRSGDRRPAVERVERKETHVASSGQYRLWLHDAVDGEHSPYRVPLHFVVPHDIVVTGLFDALRDVADRHEILRTVYEFEQDQLVQRVVPIDRAIYDFVHAAVAEEDVEAEVDRFVRASFDLGSDLPMKARVFTSPAHTSFVVLVHHIAFDGLSLTPFLQDLSKAYKARIAASRPNWATLPYQYVDYAEWQRKLIGEADEPTQLARQQLEFWSRALDGVPVESRLQLDRRRPDQPSSRGRSVSFHIPRDDYERIRILNNSTDTTPFMVLHAALVTALVRTGAEPDTVIGTPVAGRADAAFDGLVGFFVNSVALRVDASDNPTFRQLVGSCRETTLEALNNQDVPFERVVAAIGPERHPGRNPLFQVELGYQESIAAELRLGSTSVEPIAEMSQGAQFDLSFSLTFDPSKAESGITGTLEFNEDIFDHASAAAYADRFVIALRNAVRQPDARLGSIDILLPREAEALEVIGRRNKAMTATDAVEAFLRQVDARPDAPAVAMGRVEYTYRELASAAEQQRARLRRAGVRSGDVIAVLSERSVGVVAVLLAILAEGAVYLPLDPDGPSARTKAMLQQAQTAVLLNSSNSAGKAEQLARGLRVSTLSLTSLESDGAPVAAAFGAEACEAVQPAYLLYTSGSTGAPKGAVVHRGGLANHLRGKVDDLELDEHSTVIANAPLTFDVSIWQMLAPLTSGGRVQIVDQDVARNPESLIGVVESTGATVLEVVPSLLREILDDWDSGRPVGRLESLTHLMVTGESLSPHLSRRWLSRFPHIPIVNAYGPTECSDDVAHAFITEVPANEQVSPIGYPIAGIQLYVLDSGLRELPVGAIGELFVGGVGVGSGYLCDSRKTAEAFLPDPFTDRPGGRLYKTGDRARRRSDLSLEVLGRDDSQIKIRGQRIEIGEITEAIRGVAGVMDTFVDLIRDSGADRLVAWYVGDTTVEEVRDVLRDSLPTAMIPTEFAKIDRLPLTTNGKIDRRSLELPPVPTQRSSKTDPTIRRMCALFEEVLKVPVGADDDFFDLGGHSLLAVRLSRHIASVLGTDIGAGLIFGSPSPRQVVQAAIRANPRAGSESVLNLGGTDRTSGHGAVLLMVAPATGLAWPYFELASRLTRYDRIYGLQHVEGFGNAATEDLFTERLLQAVESLALDGEVSVAGWSWGGRAAFSLAVALQQSGVEVEALTLLDSTPSTQREPDAFDGFLAQVFHDPSSLESIRRAGIDSLDALEDYLSASNGEAETNTGVSGISPAVRREMYAGYTRNSSLFTKNPRTSFAGDLDLIVASREPDAEKLATRWEPFVTGRVRVASVDSSHIAMLDGGNSHVVAERWNSLPIHQSKGPHDL